MDKFDWDEFWPQVCLAIALEGLYQGLKMGTPKRVDFVWELTTYFLDHLRHVR